MPRASWYSQLPAFGWFDAEDRPGSAAYQVGGRSIPDSQQGIALPSRRGLGKWYNVTPPGANQPFPMQQTDIGPAARTGRGVDVSAAGAHQMGYSPKNFPTDANFKVEPIDLTGLGLAAKWNGGVPGDNQTAVAEGPPPPQGRKMPSSLMDMFQPQDATGQPTDFGGALRGNANAMVGLGMGLLQPANPLRGESIYGNALQGFQAGSVADSRRGYQQAQLQHQKQQAARQAAQDAFQRSQAGQQQSNWERTFARGGEQPSIVWQEDSSGNKVPYRQDPRNGTISRVAVEGADTAAAGNPYAPSGKMTTDEGKTALFADRAATAHSTITKAENINKEPGGTVGALVEQNLPAGAANVLVSGERGKSMDAQRAFVNALLRRESGAAISAGEFSSYAKEYFPQLGDTPDQIEAKRKHRAEVIAGLARESGRGYRPSYSFNEKGHITLGAPTYAGKGQGAAAPGPEPTKVPKAGHVEDGFVFKGGDPSDPKNWAPVR